MKAGKYMNNKKERIADAINRSRDELFELSKKIHDHPELGFQEHQAVGFRRWRQFLRFWSITDFRCKRGMEVFRLPFAQIKREKGRDRMLHFWRNMTHSEALDMAVVII